MNWAALTLMFVVLGSRIQMVSPPAGWGCAALDLYGVVLGLVKFNSPGAVWEERVTGSMIWPYKVIKVASPGSKCG